MRNFFILFTAILGGNGLAVENEIARCEYQYRDGNDTATGYITVQKKGSGLTGHFVIGDGTKTSPPIALEKLESRVAPSGDAEEDELTRALASEYAPLAEVSMESAKKIEIYSNLDFPFLAQIIVFRDAKDKVLGKAATLGSVKVPCRK